MLIFSLIHDSKRASAGLNILTGLLVSDLVYDDDDDDDDADDDDDDYDDDDDDNGDDEDDDIKKLISSWNAIHVPYICLITSFYKIIDVNVKWNGPWIGNYTLNSQSMHCYRFNYWFGRNKCGCRET